MTAWSHWKSIPTSGQNNLAHSYSSYEGLVDTGTISVRRQAGLALYRQDDPLSGAARVSLTLAHHHNWIARIRLGEVYHCLEWVSRDRVQSRRGRRQRSDVRGRTSEIRDQRSDLSKGPGTKSHDRRSPRAHQSNSLEHWSHESPLILDEAFCFVVMVGGRATFWIVGNFPPVLLIRFNAGKAKQCYCDIVWSFRAYTGETKRR